MPTTAVLLLVPLLPDVHACLALGGPPYKPERMSIISSSLLPASLPGPQSSSGPFWPPGQSAGKPLECGYALAAMQVTLHQAPGPKPLAYLSCNAITLDKHCRSAGNLECVGRGGSLGGCSFQG